MTMTEPCTQRWSTDDRSDRDWVLAQVDFAALRDATQQIVRAWAAIGDMFDEDTCRALTIAVDRARLSKHGDPEIIRYARDVVAATDRAELLICHSAGRWIGGPAHDVAVDGVRSALRSLFDADDLKAGIAGLDIDMMLEAD